MREELQKTLTWAVIASETSHVFCCVFPTLFSLLGLLAGLGMVVSLPPAMIALHDALHHWEVPMIVASGAVLALGWLAQWYGDRIDCHDSGCAHGACSPRKKRAHLVLKIATVLFVVNVAVYGLIHRSAWFAAGPGVALTGQDKHGHEEH